MVYSIEICERYGPNGDGGRRRYGIAASDAVSKGMMVYLVDPRTVSWAALAQSKGIAGITDEEKKSTDTTLTSISVLTDLIANMRASGAINAGDWVMPDLVQNTARAWAPSIVSSALLSVASFAVVFGRSLDTVADGETAGIRINL